MTDDQHFMQQAIALAQQAADSGEVPVGAVLVRDGEIIGSGYNRPINACDPTAHAEIIALRDAAQRLANYRLPGTTLYVTIEPCTMCVGALVHARVERIVYGAEEPKAGAVTSHANILQQDFFNHRIEVTGGVLAEQCGSLMSGFFRDRRRER